MSSANLPLPRLDAPVVKEPSARRDEVLLPDSRRVSLPGQVDPAPALPLGRGERARCCHRAVREGSPRGGRSACLHVRSWLPP